MLKPKGSLGRLILAGVPEQVNIPILICMEREIFKKFGLDVEYKIVPEGTGRMLSLLENREVDLALTVTDAFIVGKATGRSVDLAGTFVESPLVWAVASAAPQIQALEDLKPSKLGRKCRFGISRLGSGSHTMAIYTGKQLNIPKDEIDFVVANNFEGLREGVKSGAFDAFMWETFTTRPWFDRGELKKVGEVSTPWSAFSFVSTQELDSSKIEALHTGLYPALAEAATLFCDEAEGVSGSESESSVHRICREHGHRIEDARAWLSACKYATAGLAGGAGGSASGPQHPMSVQQSMLVEAVDTLKHAGLVPPSFRAEELWSNRAVRIF